MPSNQVITEKRTRVLRWLQEQDKRVIVCYGGSGSSKSHSVAQHVIDLGCQQAGTHILVTRKWGPSLRLSCWASVREILERRRVPFVENRAELELGLPNGSRLIFRGLNDPERVKSVNVNHAWAEEATELSFDDYLQLQRCCRRPGNRSHIFMSFNPISALHWLRTKIVEGGLDTVASDRSTHKDNPFLPDEYRAMLDGLAEQDANHHRIYALGEWGVLSGIIYDRWDVIEPSAFPRDLGGAFGMDFGFSHPAALVEFRVRERDIYLREHIYRAGATNSELAPVVKDAAGQSIVYCDSAEPDRIAEFRQHGIMARASKKDVIAGINFVKGFRLHITSDSPNLIKEIQGYTFRTDKDGNVLEEPVKFADHALDAARYSIFTHLHGAGGGDGIYTFGVA